MASDKAVPLAGPRSVLRVLEILDTVALSGDGATLTEIVAALGMPKTSAFSLLKTLESGGYLTQREGRYVLGLAALALGASLNQWTSLAPHLRTVLDWLAEETNETVLLAVRAPDSPEISYADVIESPAPLRFAVRVGNRRPYYCSAGGLAMLAFLPLEFQQRYLAETTFVKFTADTLDRNSLIEVLPDIRRRGVALDANGIIDGAAAVASPGFDRAGTVVCTVAIAGPTQRIVSERQRFEELAIRGGEKISKLLGYNGPFPARWPM